LRSPVHLTSLAVNGFKRSLAYEVARDGVTVNAMCPGPPTAVLLASDAGGSYVDATMNPNGGDVIV
jgi:3-oxoacyl-[acyl-carrier protein] reductase